MISHDKVAEFNHEFAGDHSSKEWRVTMYFYAAVHAINHRKFGAGKFAPNDFRHDQRREFIEQKLPHLARVYTVLEGLSRTARYMSEAHPMSTEQLNKARECARQIMKECGVPPIVF